MKSKTQTTLPFDQYFQSILVAEEGSLEAQLGTISQVNFRTLARKEEF